MAGIYTEYFQGISGVSNDQIVLSDRFNATISLNLTSYNNDFNFTTYAANGALICFSDNGFFVFGGISDAQECFKRWYREFNLGAAGYLSGASNSRKRSWHSTILQPLDDDVKVEDASEK